jgi:hypothetical protein
MININKKIDDKPQKTEKNTNHTSLPTSNIKFLVSRYNNKQLTIYSNNMVSNDNIIVIPFPNKIKKEPTILETYIKDNNIFDSIDNCFDKNIYAGISSPSSLFSDFFYSTTDTIVKKKTIYDDKTNYYLPITYYNNYKYSIAKNVEEIKRINTNHLNIALSKYENEKEDFGFIVLGIDKPQYPNPPFAFITNIENNKLFIPTKYLNDIIENNQMQSNRRFTYPHTFHKNYVSIIDEVANKHRHLTDKDEPDKPNHFLPQYYSLRNVYNKITATTTNKENKFQTVSSKFIFPFININNNTPPTSSMEEKISSTDSNDSSINTEKIQTTNFNNSLLPKYNIYVLHTNDNKLYQNAASNFNCQSNISFNQYLKSCSSNKMYKVNHCEKNENLWFNIDNKIKELII